MYTLLIILHIIGTVLGVGAATLSDILFLNSIKKNIIDNTTFGIFQIVSKVVWTGLIILVFSGFGFLIIYRLNFAGAELILNAKLWAKLTIILFLLINGIFMHWVIYPILAAKVDKPLWTRDFAEKILLIFTSGAISIVSWYSALILGAWRNLQISYLNILGIYFAILIAAILVSNYLGRYLARKNK